MDKLIRDLEAATEGSRELDGEIALYLGWVKHHAGWAHWTTPEGLENQHVPFFSDSVDDALTLVPEGWVVSELKQRVNPPVWHWYCALSYLTAKIESFDIRPDTEAPTPALALCIPALKARQATSRAAATTDD